MHLKADKLAQSNAINPLHRWFLKIIHPADPIAMGRLKMQEWTWRSRSVLLHVFFKHKLLHETRHCNH